MLSPHLLTEVPAGLSHKASVGLGGGRIRYQGSKIAPVPARRGSPLSVTHYFACVAPIEREMKLFVHVEDARAPGILINRDHYPIGELYPLNRWKAGEVIEDGYTIDLPAATPDSIALYIGLYRFDERLPVDDASATDGANRIRVAVIPVEGGAGALPVYRAPRRTAAIAIDGRLDDPGWSGVPTTGPFVRTHDGGTAKYRTEAQVVWDEAAIYVGFDGDDEDVWFGYRKNDEPIYLQEVFEVFVDADGDGRTYNELEVSPGNVTFDAYFPARREGMDLAWSSGVETAVQVRGTVNQVDDPDRGLSAEMKIPVSRLAAVPAWPPRPGDRWRFNLYRIEWHTNRRVNESSAFSPPLVGDFHHLPRFGWLEFAP